MPKREDERALNMAGRHPSACTCQDCTDRFLKRKKIKPGRKAVSEKMSKHPRDCNCASCTLLGSVENLPRVKSGPGGFLKRLFGKR